MDDDAVAGVTGFVQIARPRELTARWRAELIACWTVVANAGGAVVWRSTCGRPADRNPLSAAGVNGARMERVSVPVRP
ncbi:hypothetical protein ACWGLP_37145 [Streptomyces lydicus]